MKNLKIKKVKDVILGLLLIAMAVLFVLRSADVSLPLLGEVAIIKIVGALVVVVFIVFKLLDRSLSFVLEGIAALYGIFLEEIAMLAGVEKSALPSFWVVFLASVVVEIGIRLIFKKKKDVNFGNFEFSYDSDGNDDEDDDDDDDRLGEGEGVSYNGHKIGEVSRYIDCRDFKCAEFGKMVGQVNIYFDNTDQYKGGGELIFRKLVGEVSIYVPADWKIRSSGSGLLGEIEIEPSENEGDKILTIISHNTVGDINVIRR